jgi:hypothetical protein
MKQNEQFTFKLTPVQAQTIFSALACFDEELAYNKQEWKHTGWSRPGHRQVLRNAIRRYDRQLNSQYAATGIEVVGDKMKRTK